MPLLHAVVPEIPESRTEVVPARLARKVAPLFGVPWPEGPFGNQTWVSDYAKITLSEIARGAPLPTRTEAARLDGQITDSWQVVDRIAIAGRTSPLPNEIANATLNRFGPDTRAAVILTAVNRLLAPVQDAIDWALTLLVDSTGAPLPEPLRLAAWAGLLIETFRSQPALLAAGIHARTIQGELVRRWSLPRAVGLRDLPLTRCEVGYTEENVSPVARPHTLDVADLTFAALRICGNNAVDVDPLDTDEDATELPVHLLHDESVGLLLRRLLVAGTPADASYLWLSERTPGQLAVEALLPPTDLVDQFVRHASRTLGIREDDSRREKSSALPAVPTADQLSTTGLHRRRAALIALLTVLRHIQHSPAGRERTRGVIAPILGDIAALARATLAPDDPVAALTCCRAADMIVQTLRYDLRNDLREPVAELLTGLDRCEQLLRRGVLDRGAAAEAISSACVELNAVRWTNAQHPDAGLPTPEALDERLRHNWNVYHEALEIQPFHAGVPRPPGLIGYHLHNYAAFLAGSMSREDDQRTAIELFRDVVIPTRQAYFERSGHFRPLRHSLQVAARAATRLGEAARARHDLTVATAWAAQARRWVVQALVNDDTQRLITAEPPTEIACRFALLAVPALVLAAEVNAPGAEPSDMTTAADLINLVSRWEATTVGESDYHTRHQRVVALTERVATLLARSG